MMNIVNLLSLHQKRFITQSEEEIVLVRLQKNIELLLEILILQGIEVMR